MYEIKLVYMQHPDSVFAGQIKLVGAYKTRLRTIKPESGV